MAVQNVLDCWAAVPVGNDSMKYSGVLSLNETSKDIINLLNSETTEEDIVASLLKEYDVEETELRKDVKAFIQKLRDEKLLAE